MLAAEDAALQPCRITSQAKKTGERLTPTFLREETMYTVTNYRSKKALKDAVKAGAKVLTYQPGPFEGKTNGTVCLEGPHYPEPHRWYAEAVIADGYVVSVK
jgi:hypothetical protein